MGRIWTQWPSAWLQPLFQEQEWVEVCLLHRRGALRRTCNWNKASKEQVLLPQSSQCFAFFSDKISVADTSLRNPKMKPESDYFSTSKGYFQMFFSTKETTTLIMNGNKFTIAYFWAINERIKSLVPWKWQGVLINKNSNEKQNLIHKEINQQKFASEYTKLWTYYFYLLTRKKIFTYICKFSTAVWGKRLIEHAGAETELKKKYYQRTYLMLWLLPETTNATKNSIFNFHNKKEMSANYFLQPKIFVQEVKSNEKWLKNNGMENIFLKITRKS